MKSRRGALEDHVTSTIIAIVGIALIIMTIYLIYRAIVVSENETARQIMNSIEGKMKNLKAGQRGNFMVYGLDNWFLYGWDKGVTDKPAKCYFYDSCMCICPLPGERTSKGVVDVCQKKGICRNFDAASISLVGKYKIDDTISTGGGSMQVIEMASAVKSKCIPIRSIMVELQISRSREAFELYSDQYKWGEASVELGHACRVIEYFDAKSQGAAMPPAGGP